MKPIQVPGHVTKIEETSSGRVAYVTLEGSDVLARMFEIISGGPTIGVRVGKDEGRVGELVRVSLDFTGEVAKPTLPKSAS